MDRQVKTLFVIDAVLVCLIAFLFSFSYILNSGLFPLAYLFTGIFVCFLLITILTIFWEKSPEITNNKIHKKALVFFILRYFIFNISICKFFKNGKNKHLF